MIILNNIIRNLRLEFIKLQKFKILFLSFLIPIVYSLIIYLFLVNQHDISESINNKSSLINYTYLVNSFYIILLFPIFLIGAAFLLIGIEIKTPFMFKLLYQESNYMIFSKSIILLLFFLLSVTTLNIILYLLWNYLEFNIYFNIKDSYILNFSFYKNILISTFVNFPVIILFLFLFYKFSNIIFLFAAFFTYYFLNIYNIINYENFNYNPLLLSFNYLKAIIEDSPDEVFHQIIISLITSIIIINLINKYKE